jgi:tRNA(Ile)-lysidine synthase
MPRVKYASLIAQFAKNLGQLTSQRVNESSTHRFAVALSGGSDSLALTLLAQEAGLNISAITIDHKLRPESAQEAAQVTEWMKAKQIPHQVIAWQHPETLSGNLQALARHARYDLLAQACKKAGADVVLLGHTADDQAETVAYQQERNAGFIGLAGMTAARYVSGVWFLRPLLNLSREELRDYLRHNQQRWVEDPSNHNAAFARVRIRQALTEHPERKKDLLKLAAESASKRQRLEQWFAAWSAQHISQRESAFACDISVWNTLPEYEAIYALSRMILAINGRDYPPRYAELQRLVRRIASEAEGKATLGKCLSLWERKGQGRVMVTAEQPQSSVFPAKPLVGEPFYTI